MSSLRDDIRVILREELAAVLAEYSGVETHSVRIDTSDGLNAFACDLVERMSDPEFGARIRTGEVRFVLERNNVSALAPRIAASAIPATTEVSSKPVLPILDRKLITETDLASVAPGTLRVPKSARLTPLAKDEARRKGVRIERI